MNKSGRDGRNGEVAGVEAGDIERGKRMSGAIKFSVTDDQGS